MMIDGETMDAAATALLPGPRMSAGAAPARRPCSMRRTSSIEVSWPDGYGGAMRFDGRARDILTGADGHGFTVRAEDAFVATIAQDRTITAMATEPARAAASQLVGTRGGGHLRAALDALMPEERAEATPLHLILDDISGSSLIAPWAWSQWLDNWLTQMRGLSEEERRKHMDSRVGICTGFAPGSSALSPLRQTSAAEGARAPDLRRADDPDGWHRFTTADRAQLRRARRIDVWLPDGAIRVDAAFQDSGSTPDGDRAVLHEYSLAATIDEGSGLIEEIVATPRVLPFPECPGATRNLVRLVGTPVAALRETVLAELRGIAGCTHLNDALRALAEVPALVGGLRETACA